MRAPMNKMGVIGGKAQNVSHAMTSSISTYDQEDRNEL